MTNESNVSVKKKGFTITIYGIGDYHPDDTAEAKENGDLVNFLKREADRFRGELQEKVNTKAFLLSSCIDNIKLAESNDKYPENGVFDMSRT